MMQKIQRFGGAMFTPVLLFAFSGIMVGLCTVFQSEMIIGSIAAPETGWYQFWYVIKEGAWTLFRQVPLLFVIALPIGLAKKTKCTCLYGSICSLLNIQLYVSSHVDKLGIQLWC